MRTMKIRNAWLNPLVLYRLGAKENRRLFLWRYFSTIVLSLVIVPPQIFGFYYDPNYLGVVHFAIYGVCLALYFFVLIRENVLIWRSGILKNPRFLFIEDGAAFLLIIASLIQSYFTVQTSRVDHVFVTKINSYYFLLLILPLYLIGAVLFYLPYEDALGRHDVSFVHLGYSIMKERPEARLLPQKIDPIYLEAIRSGTKRHEYRLHDEKRQLLRVGDYIEFQNQAKKKDFAYAEIIEIALYPNWDQALQEHWEQDFALTYSDFAEAKKACERFYPPEEVAHYGLVVYTIRLLH